MLNTQSSELAESIQELKNFQVYVRVRPLSKDDQQLSSRKSPDRFQRNNMSIQQQLQQQQQLSSLYGSSSPHSPLISKQNGSTFNNCPPGQSIYNNSQFYTAGYNNSINPNSQGDIASSIVRVDEENNIIFVNDPDYRNIDKREKSYTYDGVLSESSTNYDTFEKSVLPSLSGVLEGYNATFFAYGITGSGKTHTIFGRNGGLIKPFNSFTYSISSQSNNLYNGGSNANIDNNIAGSNFQDRNQADRGICYLAIDYLLQNLDLKNTTLKFSFLEIYNENVRDLLNGQNNLKGLTINEDPATKNIIVQDLKEYQITSIAQIDELIQEGNQRRALAPTSANQFSSRSHAILILTVSQRQLNPLTQVEEIITSKLNIIDLAGSEKGSDKPGKGSLEGSNINRSLLALGNCINILSEKRKAGHHVPYRDSKLTRILKDTLGGNTKTVMIACISQSYQSLEETINTLNYASRATNIKRKISKNITQEFDYYQQKEMIKELQQELAFYKNKFGANINSLQGGNTAASPISSSTNVCENCQKEKKSILSYDCSNFESVYAKSTAHSSFDTKIKQERQLIQGQIQEITEQIKQSLLLENSIGPDISQEYVEQQIRLRNEQQGNQEEFLNRICNDLFQNVVESHQLISSLQEIEELLVQDYQKLLFYQKNPLQTPQVQVIINQLQESIRENEEIKEKMKLVLETNQEQKQNLKYVLLRIANRKQIQMEYDLKIRKQQLDFLDILEVKGDLEKQITQQNQILLEKDKLIQQITQENTQLKQNKPQYQQKSQQLSQMDLPQSFSAIKTSSDEQGLSQERLNNQLKGMLSQQNNNSSSNNKQISSKQAFSQQLLQQEQQMKSQKSVEQTKNYTNPNLFAQQTNIITPTQQSINQSISYKQKTYSLTPLTKDLLNYDNQNVHTLHNKGSISQTSVPLVTSPQNQININVNIPNMNVTPKNDSKNSTQPSQPAMLYGSKTVVKGQQQIGTPSNQYSSINSNYNNSTQPQSSTQESNLPLTFGSYPNTLGVPPQAQNSSLSSSNTPLSLLKQSNGMNPLLPIQSSSQISQQIQQVQQMYFNTSCQLQQQQANTPTQNLQSSGKQQSSFHSATSNLLEQEKENKKLNQLQQDEYINSILNQYASTNNNNLDSYNLHVNQQPQNQQQQQYSLSSSSQPAAPLFTRSKSPSNNQTEYNIHNILEQSRQYIPNLNQSSVNSQQGLVNSKTNLTGQSLSNQNGMKREPQNAVIDLFQNSTHISTSSIGQKKGDHSQQNSGGLSDKFGQPQLQQYSSNSSQILNSNGNNLNSQSNGIGLISSYKNRSQSKSGRYENNGNIIEKTKQVVSEKLLLDDKKPFLEEQLYQNNQLSTTLNNNLVGNTSIFDNRTSNISENIQMISPMDSYKNPMESRDQGFALSNKKEVYTPQSQTTNNANNKTDIIQSLLEKNNVYSDYDFQSSALHTPLNPSLYQDKSNPSTSNPFQKQSRRLINYDMDDFDDDCEPKIMSRRSSDCNGQPSHITNLNINDSTTHRNPLETESELDHDEINASGKKQQNFVNSPQIHKTSRTICTQNVNLKKKNFDVFENEV